MNKFFSILVVFFCVISNIEAQLSTSSPYSRFGLGELQNNILPEFSAIGGATTALGHSKSINHNNPATYTSFSPNSFLFSTGGWYQNTQIKNQLNQQITNNSGFSHLLLGFPLARNFAASTGLVPFSGTGYEINTRDTLYNADLNYFGDGGLSKIYFGGAYELINGLSIGANASYLFGGLNRRKQLVFDDNSFINSRSNSKINLKGYYYEIGILFEKMFNQHDKFSIGITANNNTSIRAKKTELAESFSFSGLIEIPKDTFLNSTEWGEIKLPKSISLGVLYNKDKQWLYVADYSIQNWNDYTMFNESDNLSNSMEICAGMQYTPEYNSITKYYKRIDYRFGVSYRNTPLQFDDNQLKEISISFGFGIPVKKSRTKYDFSCILGKRGTTDDNLLEEQFVRIGLGVSYDGIWFIKRKYD